MTESWAFRKSANTEQVFAFLLCVVDMIDALNELRSANSDTAGYQTILSVRRISVQLRKLLLDGNGRLFKKCLLDPTLHPLKLPSNNEATTFVQEFKSNSMTFVFADGGEASIEVPEYEQRTTIHPLYGIRHYKDQEFVMEMPFNRDIEPITLKAWMNTKVLQVDDFVFTAKDLLREIVNKEGAHLEDGKKLSMPDGSSLSMDNAKSKRYKSVNAIKFGGTSYAHYFTLCTGLYIASLSKTLIDDLPLDKGERVVASICDKISDSPNGFTGRGQMENQTYHAIMLDSDRKLRRDSIGDYSTLLKIP